MTNAKPLSNLFDAAKTQELLLGVWCAPPPSEDETENERRYADLAAAGFNMVWNVKFSVLDACEKSGVKALVNLRGSLDNTDNIDNALAFVRQNSAKLEHPALLGFSIVDEPAADWFPKMGRLREAVAKMLSGGRVVTANLFPDYASRKQLSGTAPQGADPDEWIKNHGVDYQTYVDRYMEIVRPSFLSFDFYPIYDDRTESDEFMHNMRVIADAAKTQNVPTHGFLQAISWTEHPELSILEYRWLAHCHFVHGMKLLSYFYYWAPYIDGGPEGFKSALVDYDGSITPLYYQAKTVNAELQAMSRAFLAFDHRTFMTSGIERENLIKMKMEDAVQVFDGVTLSGTGKIVTGCFEKQDDELSGFYVMNYDIECHESAKAQLSWQGVRQYEVWNGTGLVVSSKGDAITLSLPKGGAAFVVVKK